MEFAPARTPLPGGSWTRELNFLAWQPAAGPGVRELPANARVRVSLQWREAHDALPLRVGDDPYREPLASLRLVVLYQPDPAGATRPADDLEVVAQFVGLPQRLDQTLNAATYEQTVELRVAKAGRYAVRVEGTPPDGTHPRGAATLPATRTASELRPRLFVQTLDGPGRALLHDYATAAGSPGMPADAHRAVTVGAADAQGRPRPYSAAGPPHNLELLRKPDVLAFDEAGGTGQAACFAAGLAAATRGAGAPLWAWLEALQVRPGDVLRVPPRWPRR
jgi:hypothetical protein